MTAIILLLTALWHALAFWHFTFFPERTLARTTNERPINTIAAELFRFLGGINLALVVLALFSLALSPAERWPAFLSLATANLSQLLVDLRVKRLRLARGPFFTQILWGDALFTAANTGAFLLSLAGL